VIEERRAVPTLLARARRGDRVAACFAAVPNDAIGTFETSADVRYSAIFGG
jgi:hypothetical protein